MATARERYIAENWGPNRFHFTSADPSEHIGGTDDPLCMVRCECGEYTVPISERDGLDTLLMVLTSHILAHRHVDLPEAQTGKTVSRVHTQTVGGIPRVCACNIGQDHGPVDSGMGTGGNST
jgi:hypothetical protein